MVTGIDVQGKAGGAVPGLEIDRKLGLQKARSEFTLCLLNLSVE
jgi:hypothetical protein